jgi:drug/metabolite transporter (DMT)-like permease
VNWIHYALAAALALAVADVLVKFAAGKLPDSLGMLLYGIVPFAAGLAWVIAERDRWKEVTPYGPAVAGALGVGVMFTTVTYCMYAAFRGGAPISLASPLIRLGGLIVASLAGLLFWKEPLTIRYALGVLLVCSGMYLMVGR